ncbi:MAG: amylo-alpha-1,6-glucosidase [Lyngbya sp.]|nr:amylo-alpha-1,6-glucosidase [Lyngbya sp.]
MIITFGREICCDLASAESREWLITNGIGGYASGTIAGLLTRRYHGLLLAALNPPLGRTLLLAKLDETASYGNRLFPIYTNRWADGKVDPEGFKHLERFYLDGTIPTWNFACADALLEKRVWMQQGENTTYIQYRLHRATQPMTLTIKALVNHRDYHHNTHANQWPIQVDTIEHGVCIKAFQLATPLYLLTDGAKVATSIATHPWYYGFDLAVERERGLDDSEDHLHGATFHTTLEAGQSITFVASTSPSPQLNGEIALASRRHYEQQLLQNSPVSEQTPQWIHQLVLAADQFIVERPTADEPEGKTIMAGYPWFGDWGRDTMISLPGLTLYTGRLDVARSILRTFAQYVDQGMLPNRFPDRGDLPDYNAVDATLWYFEAIRAYVDASGDESLVQELFPILAEIIDWYKRGTRYNIRLDPEDGLIYAGEPGVQLTWMDAKVGDWVVTPRMGKPIEVNALWYHALQMMMRFAQQLGKPYDEYQQLAQQTAKGFARFWNDEAEYCYDVLDTPKGNDASLRPNQILAVSLPPFAANSYPCLLNAKRQRQVVDICAQELLTSYGLRSLAPDDPQYKGSYTGDLLRRDGAYHQGTVWGWLMGPFVLAHLRVYKNSAQAREFLQPLSDHLLGAGVGSMSEIFEGNAPMRPCGCPAQAWTVAEVLRAWFLSEPNA